MFPCRNFWLVLLQLTRGQCYTLVVTSFLICMLLGIGHITCVHVTTITHNGLIISIPMESCITVCSLEIVTHLREVVTHLENCGMYYINNFKPQKFPLICPCNMLHTHIARLARIIWK